MLRDARELVARARSHGVDARLELYPVNTRVFHLCSSFLPDAAKAIERAGSYISTPRPEATATRRREDSA